MNLNRIFASIFLSTVVGTAVMAQSAIKSLNDGWLFSEDNAHWQAVALPHTWNTDAYSTREYKQGKCYYKRILHLPMLADGEYTAHGEQITNKRYFLKLEAASKTSTIYINGKEVGKHRGGYTASVFDLTPYLISTKKHEHSASSSAANTCELLVAVDNADPQVAPISADFTFMGGIYRNVKLIVTQPQHFSMTEDGADGVFVSTSQVNAEKAQLSVKARLRNDAIVAKDCYLVCTLYAPDGQVLSTQKKRVHLLAGQTIQSVMNLPQVKNPILWSPELPNLYKVRTELLDASSTKNSKGGKRVPVVSSSNLLDSQEHYVGMRWCEFDAQKGFFLNGKPYKLNGMCRHQDMRPYGVALDDDMHRRDLQMLKDMGCNFIRLAHYPQAEAVLEMCDKLGMLVWEEIPVVNYVPDDVAFADNVCQQLREMIRQHYNHSSIILWGYMNEILLKARNEFPKQGDFYKEVERINALASRLENIVHEEDATRHSVMALHGSDDYNKYQVANHSQVIGWNLYQGWYGGDLTGFERYLEVQQKKQPNHPVVVSEWGAGSDLRIHCDRGEAFDFSCEYQQKYIEHYLPIISDTPYILGGSYWNFIDFSSASRGESMPHINNKGVVTPERKKKDVYYYFQAAWRKDKPTLHIATRDWQHRELVETHQQVKIYSNEKEVSLWQNGKLLGAKAMENHYALFEVEWQEGENLLEAKTEHAIDHTVVTYKHVPIEASQIKDIAVNVGSHCYFQSEKTGVTWVPDRVYTPGNWGYIGGKPTNTQTEIACTDDGPIYQTMQNGIDGYRFDVPQGRYELELLFTDTRQQQAQSIYLLGKDYAAMNEQVTKLQGFDVEVNGKRIEHSFIPGVEAGFFTAVRRSYLIEADDKGIFVKFQSLDGTAFLSGIRLRKL